MNREPLLQRALACAAALALLSTPALADDANPDWFPGSFTANVNFTNDYAFRGISQTNENAAIQGGLDWAADIVDGVGIYAGAWGSNVNFGDGDQAQVEIDIYGGFNGSIGDFSWDVMALWYEYPGADNQNYDFIEFGPTLGYDFGFASASVNYMWSPNYFAHSGDSHWITGGVEVPVPESALPEWLAITASGNVGHQAIDRDVSSFGVRDYLTWDLGATFSMFGLDLDLRYVDTDVSRDSCFGGGRSVGDLCEARAVVSIGKSF
ncbi:MAG: TorF family putative porin [Myxococcota bacterium]